MMLCMFMRSTFSRFGRTIITNPIFFREGSNLTPAHHYSDFRFKTYAPIAFRYFRELFGIQPDDFLVCLPSYCCFHSFFFHWEEFINGDLYYIFCTFQLSLCNEPLQELSNPGASGSIFYITNDDEFIIKTVQHKEAEFLQKLLPGYYMVILYYIVLANRLLDTILFNRLIFLARYVCLDLWKPYGIKVK